MAVTDDTIVAKFLQVRLQERFPPTPGLRRQGDGEGLQGGEEGTDGAPEGEVPQPVRQGGGAFRSSPVASSTIAWLNSTPARRLWVG